MSRSEYLQRFNYLNISAINDSFSFISTHLSETRRYHLKNQSDRLPIQSAAFFLDVWEMGMPLMRIDKSLLPLSPLSRKIHQTAYNTILNQ